MRQNGSAVAHTDVVIVGAGPAGLAAAIGLGQLGIRRFVIVDRQNFPRDKTCGSAVTPSGIEILKRLGAYDAVAAHAHWIDCLNLHLARGRRIRLSSPVPQMLVCSRRVFDKLLLDRALQVGGVFVPNFQVSHLLQRGDRVCGIRSAEGREIRAAYTVVAAGVHSKLGPERGKRRLISTIMGWWETAPLRHSELDFVYDHKIPRSTAGGSPRRRPASISESATTIRTAAPMPGICLRIFCSITTATSLPRRGKSAAGRDSRCRRPTAPRI